MTMEGLMDEILTADNTNISFELNFNTSRLTKNRLIRVNIDFYSTTETAKKVLPFVLEDLCQLYSIPLKVASQMNLIIESIEANIRS